MDYSVSAVIVAGGSGSRMGSEVPKQFLLLRDKPIFIYSLEVFTATFPAGQIILVLPEHHIGKAQQLVSQYLPGISIEFCTGGPTRYHSVANGLSHAAGEIVMVHDAVRPFINRDFLLLLYHEAKIYGNAIPAIPAIDSLRIVSGQGNEHLDRTTVRMIQTPQAFDTGVLKKAFSKGYRDHFTDDASVIESDDCSVHLTEGIKNNIKITTQEDLVLAEAIAGKYWTNEA